jgi:hypothetical protein
MPDELKPQSIDSPEFRELAEAWAETAIYPDPGHEPFAALIAHIDAWGARLAAIPAGYKLVPVEPTPAMFNAARTSACGSSTEKLLMASYWRNMLAAAPTPEAPCGS